MRFGRDLKAEGIIKAVYRRAAGPGVYLILEGPGIEVVRERVDTLPFVVENLMTLDYDEIYDIYTPTPPTTSASAARSSHCQHKPQ
jgi:hypothetical protein